MSRFAWAAMLLYLAAWSWAGESTVRWQHASPTVVEGSGPLTNFLQITPPPGSAVTVGWQTTQETATPGQHYVAFSGTVVIPAGQVRTPVTVDIINDAFNAGSRTFGMQITSVTGGAGWGSPNYVSATITDDDTAAPPATAPAVAWAPASTTVASGSGPTGFNLALAYAWTQPVSVQWQTNAHSAVPGSDYTTASGTMTFSPGETAKPAVVDILTGAQAGREFGLQILTITGGAWGNPNYQAITITAPLVPVATPVISPAAGTYQQAVTATASSSTAGAVLRYRLDGTAPSAADPLLPADGLAIDAPATLAVRGFADGAPSSDTALAAYAFAVAPITADLEAGTYTGVRSVTLSTPSVGAEIRYTLDGSVPTAASALASGPIELPGSCTLKAQALRTGWTSSAVFSAVYQLRVPTPALSPAPGTYTTPQTVAATVADTQAVLRYTTDGTNPTVTSTLWPAEGVAITQTTTLRVRAFRSGWLDSAVRSGTYTLRVASITADPRGGTYVGERSVVLSTTTPGALIRYTLDGSAPDGTSPIAGGPIALTATTTVRAVASLAGWRDSAAFRTTYTLRVAPVVADLASGTYVGPRSVDLSCVTAGSEIRYTLDGSVPGASSTLFTGPIVLPGTSILRAVAMRTGWRDSAILRRSYTLRVEPITPSMPAGTYVGEQQVVLACPTAGATIRYTLDGSAPTAASPAAEGPILLAGNTTVRAVAMLAGWSNSAGFRAAYKLRVPAPVPTPDAGTYAAWPLVMASCSDLSATIRYRLGATIPGSGSPVFPAGGLQLTQPTTINLVATRTGWTISLPYSAAYAVNLPPVVTGLDLSGDEDGAIAGLPVASDPEGQPLAWSLGTPPAHGEAVVDAVTGAVIYTPAVDWSGSDAFALAVSDGFSASALPVTVAVAPIDDPAVIAAAANGSTTSGSDLVLSGFLVTDIDSPMVSVAVSVSAGTISLPALGGSGATLASGTGMGDAGLVLDGAPAAVSAALAQVVWRAPDAPATAILALAGNGGQAMVELVASPVAPIVVQSAAVTAWSGLPHATQILPVAASLWRIDVLAAGRYHLWLRGAGVQVGVDLDDASVGTLVLPAATGWSCRAGTTVLTLDLAAGEHVLRCTAPADAIVAGMLVAETAAGTEHAEPVVVGPGSVAVVEAEDYDEALGNDGTAWLPVVYGTAGARRALPDIAQVQEAVGHALAYDVWVTAPGTYRLWIRASGAGDSDSINVAVDGVSAFNGINPESWPWSAQNLAWGAMSVEQTRSDIVIASAGLHRITVSFREDGVALDQLALSGIPAWRPREVPHPVYRRDGIHMQGADQVLSLDVAAGQFVPAREQHEWVRQTAPFVGEADVLRAMPDVAKQVARADVATTAAAFWQVRFTTAGTYALWLRGTGPSFSSDSWHIGLSGDLSGAGDLSLNQNLPAAALAWSNTRQDGTKATITVPAPGDYAIGLWMREDGAAMQRLVIQPTTTAAPAGTGPATSPRISVAPAGDG